MNGIESGKPYVWLSNGPSIKEHGYNHIGSDGSRVLVCGTPLWAKLYAIFKAMAEDLRFRQVTRLEYEEGGDRDYYIRSTHGIFADTAVFPAARMIENKIPKPLIISILTALLREAEYASEVQTVRPRSVGETRTGSARGIDG